MNTATITNDGFSRRKLTVVGSGNVGATAAFLAAYKELGDIVLLDVDEASPILGIMFG